MRSIGTLISEASRAVFNDPERAGKIREDKQKSKMELLAAELKGKLDQQRLANEGQLATQTAQNQGVMDVTKLKGDIEQSLRDSQVAENMGKVGYYDKAGQATLTEAGAKAGLYDEQTKGMANNNFLESTFGRDLTIQTLRNKELANTYSQAALDAKLAETAKPTSPLLEKATPAEFMSEWARRSKLKGNIDAGATGALGELAALVKQQSFIGRALQSAFPLLGAANTAGNFLDYLRRR